MRPPTPPLSLSDGQRETHPHRFTEALRRHAAAAGLPPMNVHGLRHSYATAARRAGVDIEVLSERLGHADVAITLNLYRHVDEAEHAEAAEKTAAAILGG